MLAVRRRRVDVSNGSEESDSEEEVNIGVMMVRCSVGEEEAWGCW